MAWLGAGNERSRSGILTDPAWSTPSDLKERRLARSVGTDQPDLLALLEGRGGLDEKDAVAVLLADVLDANHGSSKLGGVAAALWHGSAPETSAPGRAF